MKATLALLASLTSFSVLAGTSTVPDFQSCISRSLSFDIEVGKLTVHDFGDDKVFALIPAGSLNEDERFATYTDSTNEVIVNISKDAPGTIEKQRTVYVVNTKSKKGAAGYCYLR